MLRKLLPLLFSSALLAFAIPAADVSPETLMEAGHWKQLRRMVEPQAANTKDAQSAYFLSSALIAFEDLDGALDMAQRAVSLEPGNSRYHYQLSVVYGRMASKASIFKAMSLGGQCKDEIKKAVDLDPKNQDALWALMEFYWHAPGIAGGDQKKARSTAEDILRLNPARGNLALGELAALGKQDAEAESYYQKAVQADAKNYAAVMKLARFYLAGNRYDVAAKHAQDAINLNPGRIEGYKVMVVAQAREAHWQELDAVLAQAESRVPDDLSPYFQAGQEILLAGKDVPRAETYLRKYVKQDPEASAPRLSRAHLRIGQALEKQGRRAEAVTELEAALSLEPDLEEAKKDLKALKQK